jgi:hypothetical protein
MLPHQQQQHHLLFLTCIPGSFSDSPAWAMEDDDDSASPIIKKGLVRRRSSSSSSSNVRLIRKLKWMSANSDR